MSVVDVPTILLALPNLTNTELSTIIERAKFAKTLPKHEYDNDVELPFYDYLFEGIQTELRRRGLLTDTGRLSTRTASYRRFYVESQKLRDQIAKDYPNMTQQQEVAVGGFLMRCLATWLERGRVPVMGGTLLQHVDKALVAFDAAMPDYYRSGLLLMSCRSHKHGNGQ